MTPDEEQIHYLAMVVLTLTRRLGGKVIITPAELLATARIAAEVDPNWERAGDSLVVELKHGQA